MTDLIFLIGLTIILLPAIQANSLIGDANQTNYNSSSSLNISHFLPLFINSEINNTNGSISSLPSIEPITLASHFVNSVVDGDFKPMVNVSSSSSNYTGLSTLIARHLAFKDQNVSSSVIDHRLWTSKRVKPVREPVKESTSAPTVDSGDERTSNSFDELKFDQNYFALLNAVNHRPVPPIETINNSDSSKKDTNPITNPSSDSLNSTRSLFYYSPETYGKVSHKNHQNTAFSFNWPPSIPQSTPTPTPLTPIKSSSPSSSPLNPTLSPLILPDHPGKPSKHDTGTFTFLNNHPVIKSYTNDKQSTSNGTIKSNFQVNNYLTIDPNKLIVDRDQHLTTSEDENKNINSNDNSYNGNTGNGENEANGDEGTSETNDASSEGNNDSNLSDNLIKNVHINTIQSSTGGRGGVGVGGNIIGNPNKYYDTGAYMVSKSRSKVSQGPISIEDKNTKPLRFQDHVISQPPLTPSIDYLEEDYESTDAFPDFKNLQSIVKSSTTPGAIIPTATAKYNGPAPYRHPYYSSYYPTRFYGPPPSPYEDDNSPSKSGNNNVNSWSGLAGFLLGIIPLGILMASMVPAFVSVPVATAAAGVGRRRRRRRSLFIPTQSLHDDPVHDILGQYEMKMLRDVNCIKEILCKVAVQGKSQKMGKQFFEATINMRFNKIYHQLGIGQVMETAKRNECEKVFQCKKSIKR